MSTDNTTQPNGELTHLQEELVSYLDGELDLESRRRVEELMAANPAVRQEVRRLEHSWDLLGELPRAAVNDLFTSTTVEIVALAAEKDVARHTSSVPLARRQRLLLRGIAALAAAAIGYAAALVFWPHPNDKLVDDLPVVENLDAYRQAGDAEFLRLLVQDEVFSQETVDAP